MAKKVRPLAFSGTIGNITFYEMDGQIYPRKKSSLTRKRVLKDKEFEATRKYANRFAMASEIASPVYQALPHSAKGRPLFRIITGEAASLLYAGKEKQEVHDILWKKYIDDTDCVNIEKASGASHTKSASAVKQMNLQLRSLFLIHLDKGDKSTRSFKRAWKHGRDFRAWLAGGG